MDFVPGHIINFLMFFCGRTEKTKKYFDVEQTKSCD